MTQLTKCISTETGHRLTNYSGRCAHMHGHSYRWEVTVSGAANNNGMVMDFKDLKKILKETVDTLDHAFVFHTKDPLVLQLGKEGVKALLLSTENTEGRLYFTPFNPTVENLVEWQAGKIALRLPAGIRLSRIKCWETDTSFCEFIGN